LHSFSRFEVPIMALNIAERELLRDSVRGLLARNWPVEKAVVLQTQSGAVEAIWQLIAGQGLATLGMKMEEGGIASRALQR
jgi:hypothetical protein